MTSACAVAGNNPTMVEAAITNVLAIIRAELGLRLKIAVSEIAIVLARVRGHGLAFRQPSLVALMRAFDTGRWRSSETETWSQTTCGGAASIFGCRQSRGENGNSPFATASRMSWATNSISSSSRSGKVVSCPFGGTGMTDS